MLSELDGAVGDLANSTQLLETTIKTLHSVTKQKDDLEMQLSAHHSQQARVSPNPQSHMQHVAQIFNTQCPKCPDPDPAQIFKPKLIAHEEGQRNWLFLGIPTVPRRNNMDYLSTTLNTLLDQLPSDPADPFRNKIKAVIMNNKPGEHEVYTNAKRAHQSASDPKNMLLEFMDNPGLIPDPAPHLPDPDDLNNPTNRPGHEVRKQTCDLITLMEMGANTSDYYMFMEDDFRVCPHFVRATHYVIDKANLQHPSWLAIRVSYGMNGIVMKSADLRLLSAYLRQHTARLPPDLLWQEWVSDAHKNPQIRGRPLLVYKHNLLDHIGTVSSFAIRPNRPKWPGCYESMASVWSLSRMEQFDRRCMHDDISPCENKQSGGPDWLSAEIRFNP